MKAILLIFIGAIFVMFLGIGKKERKTLPWALGILVLALVATILDNMGKLPWNFENNYVPKDMLYFTQGAHLFNGILIFGAILVFGLFPNKDRFGSDLPALLMFSLCGALLMTSFTNLIMLFIGLEALSIPLYVLAGSKKSDLKGNEAAIKYFLMGAFSTAIFLLGCAFIYGAARGVDLPSMVSLGESFEHYKTGPVLFNVGISLVLIGLCFKASAVPFHFWSPDVYEGSPVRATVFMATIVKVAAIAACFRLFTEILWSMRGLAWGNVLAVISAITILVGNFAALRQSSVKRMLAYSGVAQAGYLLIAILVAPELGGFKGISLYVLGYIAANSIIFYFFGKLSSGGSEGFSVFSGLGKNNRMAGLLVGLSMLSLAGIPLTLGFAGKFYIFSSAFSDYAWLVVIALLGSAISISYYFRVFKEVFLIDGNANTSVSLLETILLSLAALVILGLGIAPGLLTGSAIFPG